MDVAEWSKAAEIDVFSDGRSIARIAVRRDPSQEARERLLAARKRCVVKDLLGARGVKWGAEE